MQTLEQCSMSRHLTVQVQLCERKALHGAGAEA